MNERNNGTPQSNSAKFKNFTTRFLMISLGIISIVTALNCAVFYLLPITFPFSAYSAVRFMRYAYLSRSFWFALLSILICALLFLAALSVRKQTTVFPIIALIYFLSDFIILYFPLVDGLQNGLWIMYILPTVVTIFMIVQLCFYCWNQRKTEGGLREPF